MRPLHEILWEESQDLARACREHPFVRGLGDGSLDLDAFRCYVAQDAFFLEAFARAYALAAARAPCLDDLAAFHRLLGGVLEEFETHGAYARELGIELRDVEPLPETRAYTAFLREVSWTGDLGEILAAMTPCMRLYAWLGRELAADGLPEHAYRRWIETYASAGFESLAAALETFLDGHTSDVESARRHYRRAMECELAFFGAPLRAPLAPEGARAPEPARAPPEGTA